MAPTNSIRARSQWVKRQLHFVGDPATLPAAPGLVYGRLELPKRIQFTQWAPRRVSLRTSHLCDQPLQTGAVGWIHAGHPPLAHVRRQRPPSPSPYINSARSNPVPGPNPSTTIAVHAAAFFGDVADPLCDALLPTCRFSLSPMSWPSARRAPVPRSSGRNSTWTTPTSWPPSAACPRPPRRAGSTRPLSLRATRGSPLFDTASARSATSARRATPIRLSPLTLTRPPAPPRAAPAAPSTRWRTPATKSPTVSSSLLLLLAATTGRLGAG